MPGLFKIIPLVGGLLLAADLLHADEATPAQKERALSPAETLLWMSDHLANINRPSKLRYAFRKTGTLEEGFTDTVDLTISEIPKDGGRTGQVNFFTGGRHQDAPVQKYLHGNPVLGQYLQGDVHEMSRLAEGGWPHFQRRLKLAFAETAVVEPVVFEHQGKRFEGQKIRVMPYTTDPRRDQYPRFVGKVYEFIFADQIPGSLYQIHTLVPAELKGGVQASESSLIEETLTFVEAVNT
jgi:hypothetical protein